MQSTPVIELLEVTEAASRAVARWIGKGDPASADSAAAEAMRAALDRVPVSGEIVIGQGTRGEVPTLHIGEQVGMGGEAVDIAVDPLEGTDLAARAQPDAIVALAFAPRGTLMHTPDTYMWKVAAGPAAADVIHIDASPAENVRNVARVLRKPVDELVVCVLDRERHRDLVAEVRAAGARVRLINDGDVFGAVASSIDGAGVDLYMGAGGAAEGVLAAAAIRCMGGCFMGRFAFRTPEERERAVSMACCNVDGVLDLDSLVGTDEAAFVATGVTDGTMLRGVHRVPGGLRTHSVMMDGQSRLVRFVDTIGVAGISGGRPSGL